MGLLIVTVENLVINLTLGEFRKSKRKFRYIARILRKIHDNIRAVFACCCEINIPKKFGLELFSICTSTAGNPERRIYPKR